MAKLAEAKQDVGGRGDGWGVPVSFGYGGGPSVIMFLNLDLVVWAPRPHKSTDIKTTGCRDFSRNFSRRRPSRFVWNFDAINSSGRNKRSKLKR
ncbi:hypothetical protein GWI33_016720 [Rhynchophorus ferrugineus]|uniref:Uncharacterized protein n=1 Tax=Rhynchophorus ferrugineus TaxID=354439 RepID=A0A834I183_RHYFE|nr:hypothetical protein GWI33_016720 [Rhynchophorus ferrugineus]